MSMTRALFVGIALNLFFAVALFEARGVLQDSTFIVALALLMAVAAWASAFLATSHKVIVGIGSALPLTIYFVFVSLVFFHDFSVSHLSIVLIILGPALCGTYLALWLSERTIKKNTA